MVDFGAVLTALINFVIVAAVVYFLVVVPMNMLAERRKRGQEPEPQAPAEDIVLLQEIRDLLRQRAVCSLTDLGSVTPSAGVAR